MGIQKQHQQYPHFFQPQGASLEQLVLANSKQFYRSEFVGDPYNSGCQAAADKWKAAAKKVVKDSGPGDDDFDNVGDDDSNFCNKRWCWWSPKQDLVSVAFCSETSIHGLQFMAKPKRHMSERIFWLIAFLLSLAAAIYLIYGVWDRQHQSPVIVSFQASEQDVDSIPFPAVTICNMNKFPKSKVKRLEEIAAQPLHPNNTAAKLQLTFVRSVCNSQLSFSKEFEYAFNRGTKDADSNNDVITEDSQDEMMDFLLENTLPCEELFRLCMFGEKKYNCSDIFKPIITDYGKCCTFNILPLPLLLINPQNKGKANASPYDNPVLGNNAQKYWLKDELEKWSKWKYDDGFVISKELERPWKQKRAGMPYGMSLLIDPNIEEYYCPVSDSEGIRFILHTSLEMPHVMEFGSVAGLNKEILIEVHPDMTNADDDIRDFDRKKRQCYFGRERQLKFYGPYTGGNCVDECTAVVLAKNCSCTYFYMPRDDGVRICNNDPDSADYKCIDNARIDLQHTLKDTCGHCDALCEDIAYNYETTVADLQNNSQLWNDPDPTQHKDGVPKWANHSMSVVHIFFGSETTVPKLRKRLYGDTDLIANTGGILGLCLGFSVLSAVEVVYFMTIRTFWKFCRKRRIGRKIAHKFGQMFKSRNQERIIRVNPNSMPVYPGYGGFAPTMYSKTPYGGNVGYY